MENMDIWIQDILDNRQRIAIPIMTHPGIELVGKTVYEAVTDGRVHYEAIKALNVYERDEYNTDKNDKKNYSFAGNGSLYSAYGSIFTGFVVCRA